MRCCLCALLSSVLLTSIIFAADQPGRPAAKPKPFTISEKTTRVLGPIHPDGYIDYAAVLNSEGLERVPPENNFAIPLLSVDGREELDKVPLDRPVWEEIFDLMDPGLGGVLEDLPRYVTPEAASELREGHPLLPIIPHQIKRIQSQPWSDQQNPFGAKYVRKNRELVVALQQELNRTGYFNPMYGDFVRYYQIAEGFFEPFRDLLAANAYREIRAGDFDAARRYIVSMFELAQRLKGGLTIDELKAASETEFLAAQVSRDLVLDPRLDAEGIHGFLTQIAHYGEPIDAIGYFDRPLRYALLQAVQLEALGLVTETVAARTLALPADSPGRSIIDFKNLDWDSALERTNARLDDMVEVWNIEDSRKFMKTLIAYRDENFHDSNIDEYLARMATSFIGRLIPFKDLPERNGRLYGDFVPINFILGFHQNWDCGFYSRQYLELVRTAAALRLHEFKHGALPENLDELNRDSPNSARESMWGTPLVYRPGEEKFTLYSTGINGLDEGGKGNFAKGPWSSGADDVDLWANAETPPPQVKIFRKGELPFEQKESSR